MTSALQDLLERHVASGTVPGVVASLGTAELKIVAAGAMSVGGAPMRADAIMRMQSMTKAVTTVAALRLVEAGVRASTPSLSLAIDNAATRRSTASSPSP
jgi:CubicO group peptidase (beta-lactamase class C family)